ncbi:ABC transporter substrate-binding protein [Roseiterribacter gracilis]|uniref:Sulfonate ABC transporter substrate-binding protein n=1 Tax=Roseiterribacter gracilis TaxID=2812848 RepID=A0A8S8XAR8_9PROT|nr:sulfonate ABC transporter substrate-binding protein [Rhodospirillales bacterium TMPK1]
MKTIFAIALSLVLAVSASATELRISQQFGLSYLPMIVAKEQKLIERFATENGVKDLKIEWRVVSGGSFTNEALLSGTIDLVSAGVPPFITIWAKTRNSIDVRALAALGSVPNELNTNNPNVRTLKDFSDKDRIALPAPKVGFQAIVLQMAAEQAFGPGQFAKLDTLTVGLTHPDATAALLSGGAGVSAHFTSPPFQSLQQKDPRVHRVLSSYDVLGGPHTFNVLYGTKKWHDANPQVARAVVQALDEANRFIQSQPRQAAALYIAAEKSPQSIDEVEALIRDPRIHYTTAPENVLKFAAFQARTGQIPVAPSQWEELFFPELHEKAGS